MGIGLELRTTGETIGRVREEDSTLSSCRGTGGLVDRYVGEPGLSPDFSTFSGALSTGFSTGTAFCTAAVVSVDVAVGEGGGEGVEEEEVPKRVSMADSAVSRTGLGSRSSPQSGSPLEMG